MTTTGHHVAPSLTRRLAGVSGAGKRWKRWWPSLRFCFPKRIYRDSVVAGPRRAINSSPAVIYVAAG